MVVLTGWRFAVDAQARGYVRKVASSYCLLHGGNGKRLESLRSIGALPAAPRMRVAIEFFAAVNAAPVVLEWDGSSHYAASFDCASMVVIAFQMRCAFSRLGVVSPFAVRYTVFSGKPA